MFLFVCFFLKVANHHKKENIIKVNINSNFDYDKEFRLSIMFNNLCS